MNPLFVALNCSNWQTAKMLFHFGTLDAHSASPITFAPSRDLAIYLLTPGFSLAYHRNAIRVSDTTVAKYTRWSRELAARDSSIKDDVDRNVASISAEDGLRMALRRGRAHLPYWSRLAIAQYRYQLGNTIEVAALFKCSPRTVQLALSCGSLAYDPLTGQRRLSRTQSAPPGMWSSPGK